VSNAARSVGAASMRSGFPTSNFLAYLRGLWRRRVRSYLPNRDERTYRNWIRAHAAFRSSRFSGSLEPGLLSIVTAVWDGSPLNFLATLADTISAQNQSGECEWVLIDNGCSNRGLRKFLEQLKAHGWVKVHRLEANLGIIRGLRCGLEQASGRYVLPVDGDDLLYPDALRIVTVHIRQHGYPPLLYTDEDKIVRNRVFEPYLKPDWDPVLLLNSAYIAHLGIMDRARALALGVYADSNTEGSPDWDAFLRFLSAGDTAAHIPEVVYSWRVHAASTADDSANKTYVGSSQRAALQRYLDSRPDSCDFRIENSPLLPGAHWYIARTRQAEIKFRTVIVRTGESTDARTVIASAGAAAEDEMIFFCAEELMLETPTWPSEVQAILELHPDTVMVGGRIASRQGTIREAGQVWGGSRLVWSPDEGRPVGEPGYFAQLRKRRSVSSVSIYLSAVRASFLLESLEALPPEASVGFLGAWLGAHAYRRGQRIVYTPFLSGVSDFGWGSSPGGAECDAFRARYSDLIPDSRFYSRHFSLEEPFRLEPRH
jgi:glycosyltransferase involved in cell wall biosynthesis